MGSDENMPPGFEGAQPANLLRNKLSQIILIKWRCPPRFVVDLTWRVASGEESKEVEIQNQREMRVLEAVYPRPSAIPPNPSVLMGIEDSPLDDLNTPLIPITPIEDEDAATDNTSADPVAQETIPSVTNHPNPTANGNSATGIFPGVEPDVAAAAYAAMTAIMTSNGQGNLIDQNLLIKILSNEKLIEKLITDHRAATDPQIVPVPRPPGIVFSESPPPLVQTTSRAEAGASSSGAPPSGIFYTPPNRVGLVPNTLPPPEVVLPVPVPPAGALVAKDINYYKSLIQQHGEEKQENHLQVLSQQNHQSGSNQESANNPNLKPRDLKPKIMKPCIYFNSTRGCRHGANCSYQHDSSSQQRASSMPELQSAKRMKVDREITGA
ncbi:hypothetical protein U1Q18_005941 [Sarracenia purpurea var. burkii]